MGREIRKVAEGWDHPRKGNVLQPMHDESFEEAATTWKAALKNWEEGERPDYCKDDRGMEYWEWSGFPPDREYYRPAWTDEEMTHFAVYETVSEGTPVTPPFSTEKELVDYLVECGDFWDQSQGTGGWQRENAEKFVGIGWAPSFVVETTTQGANVKSARDGHDND